MRNTSCSKTKIILIAEHRPDVHRNAYESQGEQIYKTGARSSVEKLSIKSIFNVHTVLASLPATMLRVKPRALRDKIWNPCAAARSISPCRPTKCWRCLVVILFSGRTSRRPAQTHAEHVIEDPFSPLPPPPSPELSTRKSLCIAEGGAPITVVQEQISRHNDRARRVCEPGGPG